MSEQPIRNWRQDFWFLDNSYETPISYEGLMYPSVTHAFAGAQAGTMDLKLEICKAPLTAIEGLFEKIGDPPDGFRGPDTMRKMLEYKFGYSAVGSVMTPFQIKMAEKLLFTGRRPIVYGNMVCNQFWGDCACTKHLQDRGKNVLGGLIMGVRDRLIEHVTQGVARNQTCNCENVADAFFLYAREGKLWLKPYCTDCMATCGMFTSKLSDNNQIQRFEKDWFKKERGPASEAKKTVNHQIIPPRGIHPVFNESGQAMSDDDLEDEEYAQLWGAAMWGGHIATRQPTEPEKKLPKTKVFYLSGRIS